MLATLNIQIHNYWHAGSGKGRGADVDAVVLKSDAGLPYLPGRTVKGLLREGLQTCEDAGLVKTGRTDALFGTAAKEGKPDSSKSGLLFFGNAELPETAWLSSSAGAPLQKALFTTLASTKIDENGIALDKTLRSIEVVVPVTLVAPIEGPDQDSHWFEDISKACHLVRAIGSHRTRGLGRCTCEIQKGVYLHA